MNTRILTLLMVTAALAGCGSQRSSDEVSAIGSLRQAVGQMASGALGRDAPAAAPVSPEAMAAEALRVNPGPLILVGLENMGSTQVLALVGENGGMRTYMTKNEQAVILRGGMLVGTRGLGNDISVLEGESANALVRGRRAGDAPRPMRIYTGDGRETPMLLNCRIVPGAREGFTLARAPSGAAVSETCTVGGATIHNDYLVGASGSVAASRQWSGPELGYITIQTIRP